MTKLCLDFETTTFNTGNPFDSRNKVVSYSFKTEDTSWFGYYTDLDFKTHLSNAVKNATLFIGCNCKFDLHWLRNLGIQLPMGCRVWDVQLAEFVLSGQTNSFASLNSLAELYGLPTKLDEVAGYWEKGVSTEDIPEDVLEEYNNYDVELTWQVYAKQLCDKRMTKELQRLITLQGLDLLVLQDMEYNGLKYAKEASIEVAEKLSHELTDIDQRLDSYSGGINYNSGDQLSCFLFGGTYERETRTPETRVYKTGPRKGTEYVADKIERTMIELPGFFKPDAKNLLAKCIGEDKKPKQGITLVYSTAADVIGGLTGRSRVQKDIVTLLQRRAYIEKLVSTYLKALPALMGEKHWGDYLHTQFNQVVARTGRLSSSGPNLQNTSADVDQFIVSRYE